MDFINLLELKDKVKYTAINISDNVIVMTEATVDNLAELNPRSDSFNKYLNFKIYNRY